MYMAICTSGGGVASMVCLLACLALPLVVVVVVVVVVVIPNYGHEHADKSM